MRPLIILCLILAISAGALGGVALRETRANALAQSEAAAASRDAAARLDALSQQLASLRRPADAPKIDEQQIRELVTAELRRQGNRNGGPGQGGQGGGNNRGPDIAAQMKDEVGLDEAKTKIVTDSMNQFRDGMRAAWRDHADDTPEQRKAFIDELRTAHEARISPSLTPEEMTKYKVWQGNFEQRMAQRFRPRDAAPAKVDDAKAAPAPAAAGF